LIEEKLGGKKGIKKVEVFLSENKLKIESDKKISVEKLNKWFEGSDYSFRLIGGQVEKEKGNNWWWLGVVIIVGLFVLMGRFGWGQLININNRNSWWILFLFGIVAGF